MYLLYALDPSKFGQKSSIAKGRRLLFQDDEESYRNHKARQYKINKYNVTCSYLLQLHNIYGPAVQVGRQKGRNIAVCYVTITALLIIKELITFSSILVC